VFTTALEKVLVDASREAVSRHHAHLTIEHLLLALAEDPGGERLLAASGADVTTLRQELDRYLHESLEQLPPGSRQTPTQTVAFRRVLQTAVLHVQSSGRSEADTGDILAALMQQPRSFAASLLAGQGVTRLDVLNFVSHGITKHGGHEEPAAIPGGVGEDGEGTAAQPLTAYTLNLTDRAREG